MTSPTIADLRAVLDAEASDVSPAPDVLARVSPQPAHRPRRGLIVAIAAVLTALLTGAIIAVVRMTGSAGPASTPVHWRTFSTPGFTVQYPSTWLSATYDETGTFTSAIVFFSDQPMSAPCTTTATARGTEIACSGGAVKHLTAGGVSVYWAVRSTLAADLLVTAPGTPTTIGAEPAKVFVGTDAECSRIGGRTSVTATIKSIAGARNALTMDACVDADRDSRQVGLVLASLRTMRQN